jgi:hypothetical protein
VSISSRKDWWPCDFIVTRGGCGGFLVDREDKYTAGYFSNFSFKILFLNNVSCTFSK